MKIKIQISKRKIDEGMTISYNGREYALTEATEEELAELLLAAEERIDELQEEIEDLEDAIDDLEDACDRIRTEQNAREEQETE